MAAPIRTCLFNNGYRFAGLLSARCYSRRWGRKVQDVQSAEEEINYYRNRRIIDPKRNPLTTFDPDDPVQRSMHEAAKRRDIYISQVSPHVRPLEYSHENNKSKKFKDDVVKPKKRAEAKSQSNTKSRKRDFNFEMLEENDKRFGRLIMQARSKSNRHENREIVLEGKNLIIDALKAGARMKILYFSGSDTLDDFPSSLIGNAEVYKVQYKHLKLWSDVVTPQGLLGIFELPNTHTPLRPAENPVPFTLVCDSVREGGNLGTVIRTAAAVGCAKVIVMKGCVDIWNGKVLRAAAGGHFRVPVVCDVTWPMIPAMLPLAEDIKVFIADSNITNSSPVSLEAVERIETMNEKVMFENTVAEESDDEDRHIESSASEKQYKKIVETATVDVDADDSYRNLELLNAYRRAPLDVNMYDNVDYMEKHSVLVISGETGISLPARKLAYDHFGGIVNIPMESDVDSLNCSVAASVIMYEIARQFRVKRKENETE